MLTGEERVGESCCGDCCRWSSEVRVRGTTGGCRRCAVTVIVVWEVVGIPREPKRTHERCFGATSLNLHLTASITVASSTDAKVGEVGGQAARAVGWAKRGEGHSVLRVQRGGQWRRKLDVGQIREWTTSVVRSWKHRWVQLLVWRWKNTERNNLY